MRPVRDLQKLSRNSESARSRQDRAAHHDGGNRAARDRFGLIARLLRTGCAFNWAYARAKQRSGTWRGLRSEWLVVGGSNELRAGRSPGMRKAGGEHCALVPAPSRVVLYVLVYI